MCVYIYMYIHTHTYTEIEARPSTAISKAPLQKRELTVLGFGGFGASIVPQTTIAAC